MLRALLGERAFPYPKSVYAVQDTLAAIVGTKRDAVILDPFAGSGTTLHATALLNAADGGSRRCILISNNEVEEATAGRLRQQGLYPGDTQYEAAGIFEAVTRPRCEAVITGRRPDGSPVPGVQIGGRPFADGFDENVEFFRLEYLDRDRVELGREYAAVLPTLWLKAGARGARCPDPKPSAPGQYLKALHTRSFSMRPRYALSAPNWSVDPASSRCTWLPIPRRPMQRCVSFCKAAGALTCSTGTISAISD